ncbi:MAG: hypothetical protein AAB651_01260 [Patescibacteria group bacterium]
MNKNLLKNLGALKKIKPDAEYSKRSRLLILSVQPLKEPALTPVFRAPRFGFVFKFATIPAIAIVLIMIIFWGSSYLGQLFTPIFFPQKGLTAEAEELNHSIQIKLSEIKYYLETQSTIDADTAATLQIQLQKITDELEEANALTSQLKLEESLEKIKSAEQILSAINGLIR